MRPPRRRDRGAPLHGGYAEERGERPRLGRQVADAADGIPTPRFSSSSCAPADHAGRPIMCCNAFGFLVRGVRVAGMRHENDRTQAVPGQRPRPDHRRPAELRAGAEPPLVELLRRERADVRVHAPCVVEEDAAGRVDGRRRRRAGGPLGWGWSSCRGSPSAAPSADNPSQPTSNRRLRPRRSAVGGRRVKGHTTTLSTIGWPKRPLEEVGDVAVSATSAVPDLRLGSGTGRSPR